MEINGLAKLTLLDFPGKTAATVFLAGCNMRCPFCHNSPLVVDLGDVEHIGEEEFRAFLERRRGLLDGIAVTGGEPTLRRDLPDLLRLIRSYGYATKLDTNGTSPDVLASLLDAGLCDYVAMDIKNSPEKYPMTVGIPDFDITPVKESVKLLENSGVDHEFRTTVVDEYHTAPDFDVIGRWLAGTKKYFLQNFVDSGALICPGTHGVPREKMFEFLAVVQKYIPDAKLRGM